MINLIDLIAVEEATGGTPTDTIQVDTTTESTPEVNTQVETTAPETTNTVETNQDVPSKFTIDGEEVDLDTIREWKRSGLRQSDYTRKTQELAKQRKEAQEALEVYNYLMSNQELVQKLVEIDVNNPLQANKAKEKLDPLRKELEDVKTQLKIKDIDFELNEITSKDKLVTDVDLLEIATSHNCDIKTAYTIWRGNNFEKIMAEKEKELTRKITENIKKNADVTRTLITPTDKSPEVNTYGLSDVELAFAERLEMTPEEYAKYKNPNYKMR